MFTVKIGLAAQEHDDFVKASSQANLLQSSKWAQIKDNWGNERLGVYRGDELVAVASVLIQPLPFGFTLLYIPRGPVMDYSDADLVRFVLAALKDYGRRVRAVFVKFDPHLLLKQYLITEQGQHSDNSLTLQHLKHLQEAGAIWQGATRDISATIQPRFQANLYAEQFDQVNFSKRTKQELRTATSKGLFIVTGTQELVDDFAALMKKTESRKQISLRGIDYYRKLLRTYGEDGYITMAKLDLVAREATLQTQLAKVKEQMLTFTADTRKNKVKEAQTAHDRLIKELTFIQAQRAKGTDLLALAATLSINYGETSENIYAGMDDEFSAYQAPTLVWYETALEAFRRGSRWQNMGGIENQLDGGLYRFKSKFIPVIEEFIGEFNLPVSPILYRLTNLAYKLRKRLRSKKR